MQAQQVIEVFRAAGKGEILDGFKSDEEIKTYLAAQGFGDIFTTEVAGLQDDGWGYVFEEVEKDVAFQNLPYVNSEVLANYLIWDTLPLPPEPEPTLGPGDANQDVEPAEEGLPVLDEETGPPPQEDDLEPTSLSPEDLDALLAGLGSDSEQAEGQQEAVEAEDPDSLWPEPTLDPGDANQDVDHADEEGLPVFDEGSDGELHQDNGPESLPPFSDSDLGRDSGPHPRFDDVWGGESGDPDKEALADPFGHASDLGPQPLGTGGASAEEFWGEDDRPGGTAEPLVLVNLDDQGRTVATHHRPKLWLVLAVLLLGVVVGMVYSILRNPGSAPTIPDPKPAHKSIVSPLGLWEKGKDWVGLNDEEEAKTSKAQADGWFLPPGTYQQSWNDGVWLTFVSVVDPKASGQIAVAPKQIQLPLEHLEFTGERDGRLVKVDRVELGADQSRRLETRQSRIRSRLGYPSNWGSQTDHIDGLTQDLRASHDEWFNTNKAVPPTK
ncbi:MAG: hypothetical protein RB292_03595 [Patescibacteria group bacterium]|jgi:hypothetical protein|nr:hypothetical protein [Patescibacteria group bacterium]